MKNYTALSQKHKENCEDSKIERTSRIRKYVSKHNVKHIKRKIKHLKE